MPDKNGTRYLRTVRKLDPSDPQSVPGVLYRRVYADRSFDEIWWPDSLATYNPEPPDARLGGTPRGQ